MTEFTSNNVSNLVNTLNFVNETRHPSEPNRIFQGRQWICVTKNKNGEIDFTAKDHKESSFNRVMKEVKSFIETKKIEGMSDSDLTVAKEKVLKNFKTMTEDFKNKKLGIFDSILNYFFGFKDKIVKEAENLSQTNLKKLSDEDLNQQSLNRKISMPHINEARRVSQTASPPKISEKLENSSEIQVTSAQKVGPIRRTMDQNIETLKKEFREGLFFRTFSDPEDEYNFTMKPKLEIEDDSNKVDKRYWASSGTLQEGAHLPIWNPTQTRTGYFISSQAKVGGWNVQDMATDNPRADWNDERIKNYFPKNFPDIAFTALFNLINNEDPETIRMILNLDNSVIVNRQMAEQAQDFILNNMDRDAPDHATLLSRIPNKYKTAYDIGSIQNRMKEIASEQGEGVVSENPEGKVNYKPHDVVGIYVNENNQKSIDDAAKLQERHAQDGLHVPLVTYNPEEGSIRIYKTKNDLLARAAQ